MRILVLFILLLAVVIGGACTAQPDGNYTLYLVRHAEKQAVEGKDPDLTDAGNYRSEQ